MSIRPNPASGFLFFENVQAGEGVVVYDLFGKKVLDARISGNGSINVNHLTNGVYMISVEGYAVRKFIKI